MPMSRYAKHSAGGQAACNAAAGAATTRAHPSQTATRARCSHACWLKAGCPQALLHGVAKTRKKRETRSKKHAKRVVATARGKGGARLRACMNAHLDDAALVSGGQDAVRVQVEGQPRCFEGVAQHRAYLLTFRAWSEVVQRVFAPDTCHKVDDAREARVL